MFMFSYYVTDCCFIFPRETIDKWFSFTNQSGNRTYLFDKRDCICFIMVAEWGQSAIVSWTRQICVTDGITGQCSFVKSLANCLSAPNDDDCDVFIMPGDNKPRVANKRMRFFKLGWNVLFLYIFKSFKDVRNVPETKSSLTETIL